MEADSSPQPQTSEILRENTSVALNAIKRGSSVSLISFPFSDEQIQTLSQINVAEVDGFDHQGQIGEVNDKIRESLARISDRSLAILMTDALDSFSQAVFEVAEAEAAWVSLQTFPTTDYQSLRWHTDGHFYSANFAEDIQVKYVWCPYGRSTQFAELPLEKRRQFQELEDPLGKMVYQRTLGKQSAESLAEMSELKNAMNKLMMDSPDSIIIPDSPREAAVFRVGDIGFAAIHSRPISSQPRLFYSIVPCSHAQIEELKLHRGL